MRGERERGWKKEKKKRGEEEERMRGRGRERKGGEEGEREREFPPPPRESIGSADLFLGPMRPREWVSGTEERGSRAAWSGPLGSEDLSPRFR